jgi:hypothetical protein
VAVLLAAGIAVAVLAGGDDGGPPASSKQGTTTSAPMPLSRSALIAEADAVCAESQRRYLEIRDPESERAADIPYAEALVRFATTRVRELGELTPPPSLASPYDDYVAAQERVLATDKEALAAARVDDTAGVEAARDERDAESEERYDLAREIGLKKCSANRG